MIAKKLLSTLNEEQLQAATTDEKLTLCLAGAGSGKTYTMITRIIKLTEDGVPPDSILALTFTNAAAAEMLARYSQRSTLKTFKKPEFKTFHAFCYSLICYDLIVRGKLGYSKIPGIATDNMMKLIEAETKTALGIKLSTNQLADPKRLSPADKQQADIYKKAVKKALISKNLITFDIMCTDVCKLFESNDPCTAKYKNKYKYIMVDEFQDTDSRQFKFVSSFPNSNIFLIGDSLQAIYGFRGADSSIIKMLSKTPGWNIIKLHRNYRSTKQICDFANSMSNYANSSYRIPLNAEREGEKVVETHSYHHLSSVVANIIDKLPSCEGTVAILCRTNRVVSAVSEILEENGILFKKKDDPIESDIVIHSLFSDADYIDWLASSLPDDDIVDWLKVKVTIEDPELLVSEFLKRYKNKSGVSVKIQYKESLLNAIKTKGLEKLSEAEMLERSSEIEVPKSVESSLVYVGTIHSAKGLEYNNVFMPDVGTRNFKLNNEEDLNCYYVGITRAKDKLAVYFPERLD